MTAPFLCSIRAYAVGVALFCSAFNAFAERATRPAAPSTLQLRECRLDSAIAGGSAAARCGWYRVAEDRDRPQGKALDLHVAVIPALQLKPAADPLFVVSGGPGQGATDFYLSVAPAFARVRRNRDIVIIDQRGTGQSNRLDCDFPDDSELAMVDHAQLRKAAQACLAGLPGDPRFYTTSVAVRDLDDVRIALGYESINLYGVSYGTRVAQHYMRRYPDRVRSAILDGVVPAELPLGPDVAIEAQRALDAAFARCAGEKSCRERFPEISQHFRALQARLQAKSATLSIPDPVTAEPMTTTLGAAELGAAVRLLSYADETAALLPLLIHEAQVTGRPQALAAQYVMIKQTMDEHIADAMHFAVVCSEDAPRWSESSVSDAALARTYLGTAFMSAMQAICADWPRGPVDPEFGRALRSSIPTLILSGGNDPVTPARYGEQILAGLPNAQHLVLDGQGHGQIGTGCMPRVAANFITAGSTSQLDIACLKSIAPAPFMLSRSASAP